LCDAGCNEDFAGRSSTGHGAGLPCGVRRAGMPEPLAAPEIVAAFLHLLAPVRLATLASERGIDWLLATIAVGGTILSALIDWA
jgi:hypothetical protein